MPNEANDNPPVDPLTIGELISLSDASKLTGFSVRYLNDIANNGRLKAKKIGRQWVTTLAAIEDYKRTRSHTLKEE